jgi:flavodoxin
MTDDREGSTVTSGKAAIIYASIHHGNTRQIATLLASQLDAELMSVEEAQGKCLKEYRVVGIGSGIYFGRHHDSLLKLVDSWNEAPDRVFIFSTAGLPVLRYLQHTALRGRLVRRGCSVVGEFCCRGWDTVGPLWLIGGINRKHPNERDLDRVRRFAERLLASR